MTGEAGDGSGNEDGGAAREESRGYFVFDREAHYGPATLAEIRQWRLDDRLSSAALLWDHESGSWVRLNLYRPYLIQAAPRYRQTTSLTEKRLSGTKFYTGSYREGRNRRVYLRIKTSLRMEYCSVDPVSKKRRSLMATTVVNNISNGGLGFTIYRTSMAPGTFLFLRVWLDEHTSIDALAEVVRITNQRDIGVGFREIKGKSRLAAAIANWEEGSRGAGEKSTGS